MIWMLIISCVILSVALCLCIYSVCSLDQSIDLRKRAIQRRYEAQAHFEMSILAKKEALKFLKEAVYERKLAQYHREINVKNHENKN